MRIEEITEFPDGTRIAGLLYHPSFEQEMNMWFKEKGKHRVGCDFCDNLADYDINVGNWRRPYMFPKDYYYHHVCKQHLFIRKCDRKKDREEIGIMCDFCDSIADFYIRAGDELDYSDDNFKEEDHWPRRHFCCEKHIRIIKYDNFRVSEWYDTYMRI